MTRFHIASSLDFCPMGQDTFSPPYLNGLPCGKEFQATWKSPMINKYLIHIKCMFSELNSIASGGCLLLPICFSWQNPVWQSPDWALLMLVWKRVQLEMKAALQSGWLLRGYHFRAWEWLLIKNYFTMEYTLGKKLTCLLRYSVGFARAGEPLMGLEWWQEVKNPIKAKNPDSTS